MRNLYVALAAIAILAVTGAAAAAQQGNKPNKKPPVQTPDKGIDDQKQNPGQGKKDIGDKDVASVVVTTHPTGALMAELDESFEEAVVLTVKPDGTRVYTTMRGAPKADAPIPAPPVIVLEEK
jgi:hypothetical protein